MFGGTGVVLRFGGIPGGELDLEIGEAEGLKDGLRELDARDHLVFDLLWSAEDVCVILGEAADAEEAVHGAGALVAVHCPQLTKADGKIAIAVRLVRVNEDMEPGSSWA